MRRGDCTGSHGVIMSTLPRQNIHSGAHPGRASKPFLREKPQEKSLRHKHSRDLVSFAKLLHERHYVSGTDGNLSVRLEAGHILTTPTGVSKGRMHSKDMVVVDSDGKKVSGSCAPTSELGMHLTIYRLRPDVRAVVHAHPCVATALASAGMDLTEPICSELVLTLGRIPLAPYAHPGTDELSQSLAPFILDHNAILMQNHGVVAYGQTLERAYLNMESVEHCARIMLVTKLLGRCRVLSDDEVFRLLSVRGSAADFR